MSCAPQLPFTLTRATTMDSGELRRQGPSAGNLDASLGTGARAEIGRYRLAYDDDCGPCTKFKRAVEFFDTHRAIEFVPLAEANDLGILAAVPERLRSRSFHLIAPTGRIESGASALRSLIRLLPSGWLASEFIFSTPSGRRLATFVYSSLSRLHDRGACGPQVSHGHRGEEISHTILKDHYV
jgi:predicted DCC family thiol-disulfide oxidoreductase YuxK